MKNLKVMKKVLFTMAVVAATAFVSCNNKAKDEATDAPADSIEALIVTEESIEIDSVGTPVDSAAATTTATDSVPA